MEVILPDNLTVDQSVAFVDALHASENAYALLRKSGASPQVCRDVLPTCLKTEIVMTANFREWRHFISLRGSKAAHPKIRVIAMEVLRLLSKECPVVFEDIVLPI
jgi:thymidylate synthase (FAD)